MKKFNLKTALALGIGTTVFFIIIYLWKVDVYTNEVIMKAVITALITGVITGVLLGFIFGRYKSSK